MSEWTEVFGRLHPLVLHLPIGIVAGLAGVELVSLVRKGGPAARRPAVALLAWLAAISSAASVATGLIHAREPGFDPDTLELHRWLGIALAVATLAAAVLVLVPARRWPYRVALAVATALLVPAGHFGGALTHGEDFLTAPLADREAFTPVEGEIGAILGSRCVSCHSESKAKGGLSLESVEGIVRGGKSGPALVPGEPGASELVRRIRLPLDAKGHMPPRKAAQPSEDQIEELEAWIAAGAFEAPPPVSPSGPDPAPPEAIAALRGALVHVEPAVPGSNELRVDFAAVAGEVDDDLARELLEPVIGHARDLSLARSRITDATLALVARMPRLVRLDVRGADLTDLGLASLAGHPRLEILVLAQTRLTDAALDVLESLPALQKVYLWRSGITAAGLARLREARPAVEIDAGDEPPAAILATETEITLSSDGASASSLDPANATCPVTGSPVDPRFAVVHSGRVVGFCCPECPRKFWADPAKFGFP